MKLVHIIDNFLLDPISERERALAAEYKTIDHHGLDYRGISFTDDSWQRERIAQILGISAEGEWEVFWRRYLEAEKNETYIHNDCRIGTFTGILFLNSPEQCKWGTAFWMHKLYRWMRQPTIEEINALGLDDTPELWDRVYQDGFHENKWTMLDYAPMAFNRLILFDSTLYHSRYPQTSFGSDINSARLIKVFFFKPSELTRPTFSSVERCVRKEEK